MLRVTVKMITKKSSEDAKEDGNLKRLTKMGTVFDDDMSFWGKLLLIFSILTMGFLIGLLVFSETKIKPLGQSICEEEYGMDYSQTTGFIGLGKLVCKDTTQAEQYDGIEVELREGGS